VVRVGTGRFTLRILQDGVVGPAPDAQGAAVTWPGSAPQAPSLKRASVTIEPRPFMEQALAEALPQMEGDFVGELQKKTRAT
jgi:hypothetical protein